MATPTRSFHGDFCVTRILLPGRIADMNSLSTPPPESSGERWRFLRDVIVFQFKLLLDNLRDFALVPISLVAALIDLVIKASAKARFFIKCCAGARTAKR